MALRVLFFGTPAFAVPTLDRLSGSPHQIVAVVTQPDRPRDRGHALSPPPVKTRALALGLPVLQPTNLRNADFETAVGELRPDLGVIAAYGRLLPDAVLSAPAQGMVNVHASLLPRWRGAAPVHRAILAGDATTGITIMRVVSRLDAGPMLAKTTVAIDGNETSEHLEHRLADLGADLLVETVDRLAQAPVPEEPQDEAAATYARRLERADSPVDWDRPAQVIHDQIRGLQPWPLATSWLSGRRVLLRRSSVVSEAPTGTAPGTIVTADYDRLEVAASPGVVGLQLLQFEGRAAMSAQAFLNGTRLARGDRFGEPPGSAA